MEADIPFIIYMCIQTSCCFLRDCYHREDTIEIQLQDDNLRLDGQRRGIQFSFFVCVKA